MKILITGLNNYLGKNIASYFAEQGHDITCLVRNKSLFQKKLSPYPELSVVQADLLRETYSTDMPAEADAAFYLNEGTSDQGGIYKEMELISLQNFIKKLRRISCQHLIYVTRLRSPMIADVLNLLRQSYIPYTVLRTSNIIGKESVLMNIMGKLTSRLFILASSSISKSRCQPIALTDVLCYMKLMILNPQVFNRKFDLGGPDSLSYKEMVQKYLKICQLKNRYIVNLPGMSGGLADFLLSITTGLSMPLARTFNRTARGDLLCEEDGLRELIPHQVIPFDEAVKLAMA